MSHSEQSSIRTLGVVTLCDFEGAKDRNSSTSYEFNKRRKKERIADKHPDKYLPMILSDAEPGLDYECIQIYSQYNKR